jgi:hypothetical protein
MDSKEYLVKTIKDWVRIDNELRALQKELSARKNEKSKISDMLMAVMKKNEIDCFDTKNDGQIIYAKKNIKKPITKKVLLNILSNFYEGDSVKAEELNNYILENREVTVKETISRKINNNT